MEASSVQNDEAPQVEVSYTTETEHWTITVEAAPASAIEGRETYDGVTVCVSAPEGAFPEGTTLEIVPVTAEEVAAAVAAADERAETLVAFDITFRDAEGSELQPADGYTVSVTFEMARPELAEEADLQVYHVAEETAEPVSADVTQTGGSTQVEVQAESFSVYVVVDVKKNETVQKNMIASLDDNVVLEGTLGALGHKWKIMGDDGFAVFSDNTATKWKNIRFTDKAAAALVNSGDSITITVEHTYQEWAGPWYHRYLEDLTETFTITVVGACQVSGELQRSLELKDGGKKANGGFTVAPNTENYTVRLAVEDDHNFELPEEITVEMAGTALTAKTDYSYDSDTGVITVFKVTGNLNIKAVGDYKRVVYVAPGGSTNVDGCDSLSQHWYFDHPRNVKYEDGLTAHGQGHSGVPGEVDVRQNGSSVGPWSSHVTVSATEAAEGNSYVLVFQRDATNAANENYKYDYYLVKVEKPTMATVTFLYQPGAGLLWEEYATRHVKIGESLGDKMPKAPTFDLSTYVFTVWSTEKQFGTQFKDTTVVKGDMKVYARKSLGNAGVTQYHVIDTSDLFQKAANLYLLQNPGETITAGDVTINKMAVIGENSATNPDYFANGWTTEKGVHYYHISNNQTVDTGSSKWDNVRVPVNEFVSLRLFCNIEGMDYTFDIQEAGLDLTQKIDTIMEIRKAPEYTVKFMDGDVEFAKETVLEGGTVSAPNPAPSKDGHTFKGWKLDSADGQSFDFSTRIYGDLTLHAAWEVNLVPVVQVTLTYSANADNDTVENMPTGVTANKGERVTISNGKPTREGYDFLGWSANASDAAADPNYAPGSSFDLNGDLTLYAVWQKKAPPVEQVTLTYDANAGSDIVNKMPTEVTVKKGETVTIPSTAPTRGGYQFLGWSATASATAGDPAYAPGSSFALTGALTLYAIWEKTEKISNFVEFGGTKIVENTSGQTVPDDVWFAFELRDVVDGRPTDSTITNGIKVTEGANAFTIVGEAYSMPGTYYYDVSEVQGSDKGWTYDDTVYHVVVEVKESPDQPGGLAAEIVRLYTDEQEAGVDGIVFTNTYTGNNGTDPGPGPNPDGPGPNPSTTTPDDDDDEGYPDGYNPLDDLRDPEVPLADLPETVVPTTEQPANDELADLEEPEVPLADAPKTGDSLIAWVLAAGVSGVGLVWLALTNKKRRDESAR